MRKIVISIITLVSVALSADTFEYDKDSLRVRISQESVNRVVLPYEIEGKIFSNEKNIKIETSGKEAYIKLIPQMKMEQVGEEIVQNTLFYPAQEAEVFFVTAKKTYSIVFVPDKIDTRTIYITDKNALNEKAQEIEKISDSYIATIKQLFKRAINDNLDGYIEKTQNEEFENYYYIDKEREIQEEQKERFFYVSDFTGQKFNMYRFYIVDELEQTEARIKKAIDDKILATCRYGKEMWILGEKNDK